MKRILFFIALLSNILLFSQEEDENEDFKREEIELKGEVFDEYLEPFANALVSLSNGKTTTSNHEGVFKVKAKLPVTITVSYIGYSTEKLIVNSNDDQIGIILKENSGLEQIVLSATRTPERLFESPVTMSRMSLNDIKKTPSISFYEAMENVGNLQLRTSSILLKSANAKGLSTLKNNRFVQLIDGVDNMFPSASFSLGNMIGLVDMDVENVEILEGASSALYGTSAFNGVMLIKSKNPFDYSGVSAKIQGGVTQQKSGTDAFYFPSVRFAYKFDDKFAAKASFSYYSGKDWNEYDYRNTKDGIITKGDRTLSDYDGVNTFGDEFSFNEKTFPLMKYLSSKVAKKRIKYDYSKYIGRIKGIADATQYISSTNKKYEKLNLWNFFKDEGITEEVIANVERELGTIDRSRLQGAGKNQYLQEFAGRLLATSPKAQDIFKVLKILELGENRVGLALAQNKNITRNGYTQNDLIGGDNSPKNIKFNTSLHYRPFGNNKLEVIWTSRFNRATSLFGFGANKFIIKNANLSQHVLEFKGESFFLRGFTTLTDSGDTYNIRALGKIMNEYSKPTGDWIMEYLQKVGDLRIPFDIKKGEFKTNLLTSEESTKQARNKVNEGRIMPGTPEFEEKLNYIKSTPITEQGSKFVDRSRIYNVEGNFNFNKYIDFMEIQIGGNYKKYILDAPGYITYDSNVETDEYGIYTQLRKKLVDNRLDLVTSLRYDKVKGINATFSPRLALSYTAGENRNHNMRVSVQQAYRAPTIDERYDVTNTGGNSYLLGNSMFNINRYRSVFQPRVGDDAGEYRPINRKDVYDTYGFVKKSFDKFYNSMLGKLETNDGFKEIATKIAINKEYDLIEVAQIQRKLRPERVLSFEAGYRTMLDITPTNILEVDISGYYNNYNDFIRYEEFYFPMPVKTTTGMPNPDVLATRKIMQKGETTKDITEEKVFGSPFNAAILTTVAGHRLDLFAPKNSESKINTYGVNIGLKTRIWNNYKVKFNYSWNDYTFDANGDNYFTPDFNTPKHNIKMMFGNENVFKNIGFNIAGRWHNGYYWHSEFASGNIDPATVIDAQLSYSLPKMKSKFKLGANNLFGKPYWDNIGSGKVGNIYYLSWIINE